MATEPWDDSLASQIREAFESTPLRLESFRGQPIVFAPLTCYLDLVGYLQRLGFEYLVDLTAIDRYTMQHPADERFELVLILHSFAANRRVRVRVPLGADHTAPSLANHFAAANWAEREVFDMFGIHFSGHPNLKRILMPEDWNGFPLRRDSSIVAMDQAWVRQHLKIESGQ